MFYGDKTSVVEWCLKPNTGLSLYLRLFFEIQTGPFCPYVTEVFRNYVFPSDNIKLIHSLVYMYFIRLVTKFKFSMLSVWNNIPAKKINMEY